MSIRNLAIAFALTAGLALPAHAEDAQSIIAKNTAARGGAEALAAMHSIKLEGRAIFPGNFEVAYNEWRTIDPNPRGRIVFSLQGLDLIQAFDGKSAWKVNPFNGRKDAENMSADETRQAADNISIFGPLLAAAKDGSTVTYLGREDFDGTDAYKLRVAQKDGDEFTYWLDPDTMLEIKILERRKIRGAEQVTETELGDYEKVGGVYFPMSLETWTQGQTNQKSQIIVNTATANPPLTDDLFNAPASPAKPTTAGKGN